MEFKFTKNKVITSLLIIFILSVAFWYGGGAPGNVSTPASNEPVVKIDDTKSIDIEIPEVEQEENFPLEVPEEQLPETELEDATETEPEVSSEAEIVETGEINEMLGDFEISDVEYTCTISVRCDTILNNIDWLDPEKVELVPEDGVIFPVTEVAFFEGESVFNVLQREMEKAKIHMEFVDTPIYNSAYIEGINNLYEFDCGELSGWVYKVNNWFPNYGASRYQLKDRDVIEFVYTCDLGVDVGGSNAVGE